MAVVIESVTASSAFEFADGEVSDRHYWDITKPSGLAVGDLMICVGQTEAASFLSLTDWTAVASVNRASILWKFADADDVAGSAFRFLAINDATNNNRAIYRLYRISGGSSTQPFQDTFQTTFLSTAVSPQNFTPGLYVPSGTLLIHFISSDEVGTAFANNFSISTTGITGAVNERWDDSTPEGAYSALYDQISTSTGAITNIAVSYTADTVDAETIGLTVLAFYPQQDANASLSLTQTTNTAFPAAESAGANASPAFTETTNESFTPTGKGTSPTRWVNEPKPDTDWINEQR